MKIAHLLMTRRSRFGGAERYAIELANEQAKRHDVTVVLSASGTEVRADGLAHRLDRGVRVITVPTWRPLQILAARRAISRLAPDVTHTHVTAGSRAVHGCRWPHLRVATLHWRYTERHHHHADALISIAPWQLADIPEIQRSHTRQIDNWTIAPPMNPAARQRIRSGLKLRDDEFLIGALGRVVPSKGFDRLVDAFTRADLTGARLAIVGSGSEWARLRARAPGSIIMPGFAPQPEDWLSAFDAFISSADEEPFGLVFLEAMAAGLPILATASEGAQYLAPRFHRPLLPIGDIAAMSTALRQLAAERPCRVTYALDDFQLQAQAGKIEEFYQQELSRLPTSTSRPR